MLLLSFSNCCYSIRLMELVNKNTENNHIIYTFVSLHFRKPLNFSGFGFIYPLPRQSTTKNKAASRKLIAHQYRFKQKQWEPFII